MKKDSDSFKHHTGLTPEQFDTLFDFVNPGSKAKNMKYYEEAFAKSEINVRSEKTACMDSTQVDSSKPDPTLKLLVVEQLFFFIVWL